MPVINIGRVVGPQGPQGEKGDVGPRGPQGEIGPQGERGPQGIQGIQGKRGPQGYQGVRGEKGEPGTSGVAVSVKGTYAFNIDDLGHLILSYTGDDAPNFSIREGHLILNFDTTSV